MSRESESEAFKWLSPETQARILEREAAELGRMTHDSQAPEEKQAIASAAFSAVLHARLGR